MEQAKLVHDKPEYRYSLTSTGDSSNKYGNCEVCGKYASEVYHQVEERGYFNPVARQVGWTQHLTHNVFGHPGCLQSLQSKK